jgi:hypothetical protein
MTSMARFLRLLTVLLLSVALDLAAPVTPEALETSEQFEEAAHGIRPRRAMVLARNAATPAPRDTHHARVQRPARVGIEVARRIVTLVPARKAPPPVAESSSAPEDH